MKKRTPLITCFNQQITENQIKKIQQMIDYTEGKHDGPLHELLPEERLQFPLSLSDLIILSTKVIDVELRTRKDAVIILFSALCDDVSIFNKYSIQTLNKSQGILKRILTEFVNQANQPDTLEIKNKKFIIVESEDEQNEEIGTSYPLTDIDEFINLCSEMEKFCQEIETGASSFEDKDNLLKDIKEQINNFKLETLVSFVDENLEYLNELLHKQRVENIKKICEKKLQKVLIKKQRAFKWYEDINNDFGDEITKKEFNYEFYVQKDKISIKVLVYFGKKGLKTILLECKYG